MCSESKVLPLVYVTIKSFSFVYTVILTPPNDTIVFINQSAVFSCETDGGFIDWRINGTFYQDIQRAVRNDIYISSVDITNSQLTIFARVKYNPTEIQCVTGTVGGGIADESPIVILVIESNVCNIHIIYRHST